MTGTEYCILYEKSPDKAYRALFEEYCGYVHTVVYNKLRSCGTKEDIEECVSDIFADIFFNYDTSVRYSGDLQGYIGTVAKRRAINMYHSLTSKYGRTVSSDDEDFGEIKSDTDMEADSDNAELREIILGSVNALGEPDSTIIIQKFYYNRTSQEIGEMLSMKASAVRMRCGRAIKKLEKIFTKLGISL